MRARPGRSQFEGQRHPFQPLADVDDVECILRRRLKIRPQLARTLEKEPGCVAGFQFCRRFVGWFGQFWQRRRVQPDERLQPFLAPVEPDARRDQHFQPWRLVQ